MPITIFYGFLYNLQFTIHNFFTNKPNCLPAPKTDENNKRAQIIRKTIIFTGFSPTVHFFEIYLNEELFLTEANLLPVI